MSSPFKSFWVKIWIYILRAYSVNSAHSLAFELILYSLTLSLSVSHIHVHSRTLAYTISHVFTHTHTRSHFSPPAGRVSCFLRLLVTLTSLVNVCGSAQLLLPYLVPVPVWPFTHFTFSKQNLQVALLLKVRIQWNIYTCVYIWHLILSSLQRRCLGFGAGVWTHNLLISNVFITEPPIPASLIYWPKLKKKNHDFNLLPQIQSTNQHMFNVRLKLLLYWSERTKGRLDIPV